MDETQFSEMEGTAPESRGPEIQGPDSQSPVPPKSSGTSELGEYLEAIGMAIILAIFIMAFIARSFSVEGSSMVPTLYNGERVLVDEISYRLTTPKRGEIIVFRLPADPRQRYIKRVIGLPGDSVSIENRKLYVNGKPVEESYLDEQMLGDYGPVTVPAKTVFVLGDNRNNSEDSRYERVGFVPRGNIIGRAVFRFWPLNKIGILFRPQVFKQMTAGSVVNAESR